MFIIHLGSSGFPLGTAQMQRIRLTFKGLKLAGSNPLIINKHSVYKTGDRKRINRYQGIPYVFLSALISRPDNFISRNLNKLSGDLSELIFLIKKRKQIQTAIFYDASFLRLLYYRLLSKVLNFKLIIQYVELRSSIHKRRNFFTRLNDQAFDNFCFYLCDGSIVISEFLKNRTILKNKNLPLIKIPAICDFEEFDIRQQNTNNNSYLMYCGTMAYLPVVLFVLELYCKLVELDLYHGDLLLAIGGSGSDESGFKTIEEKIENSGIANRIIFRKNVPHNELIKLYLDAELLIVPMRNIEQDIAGFHHKIGEYTAAAKPIISTNLGELQYYFKDGFSAILADEYSYESYIERLSKILSSKETLNKIGEEGFKVGQEQLNFKTYSDDLNRFIMEINK
jgi:glycosyltransferase involved in cell wall biosynthesis